MPFQEVSEFGMRESGLMSDGMSTKHSLYSFLEIKSKFAGHIFFCLFSFSPFSTQLLETSIKIPSRRIDKTLKLHVFKEPTCHFYADDLRRMSPLRVTPLSLMECLCSAPRTCHKSQLISPHKCHSSLILPHQAIMPSSIMHCAPGLY